MDLDRTPAEISDEAAQAVRQLNHRTRAENEAWQHPGDAYSVVSNLVYLAGGLPQALAQIRALIGRLEAQGNLRGEGADLHETHAGLDDARAAAEQLYTALNRAHAGLSSLAYQA